MRRNLSVVVESRETCVRLTRLEIGIHNLLYAAHALYAIFLFVRFGEIIVPVTVPSTQFFVAPRKIERGLSISVMIMKISHQHESKNPR